MPTNNQQKPRRTAASTSIGSKGSLYLSERSRAELAVPLEHCLPDCSRMKMHVLITVFSSTAWKGQPKWNCGSFCFVESFNFPINFLRNIQSTPWTSPARRRCRGYGLKAVYYLLATKTRHESLQVPNLLLSTSKQPIQHLAQVKWRSIGLCTSRGFLEAEASRLRCLVLSWRWILLVLRCLCDKGRVSPYTLTWGIGPKERRCGFGVGSGSFETKPLGLHFSPRAARGSFVSGFLSWTCLRVSETPVSSSSLEVARVGFSRVE